MQNRYPAPGQPRSSLNRVGDGKPRSYGLHASQKIMIRSDAAGVVMLELKPLRRGPPVLDRVHDRHDFVDTELSGRVRLTHPESIPHPV